MSISHRKVSCPCGWRGLFSEMLKAKNPFDDRDEVYACPDCKTLESTAITACDEPGCWSESTCGTPTKNGYRSTCRKHRPTEEAK